MFCLETFILDIVFQITEKQQQNRSKQLFDIPKALYIGKLGLTADVIQFS